MHVLHADPPRQSDQEIAYHCMLVMANLEGVTPETLPHVTLEMKEFVLEAPEHDDSVRRFNTVKAIALRFPSMKPEAVVPLARIMATGVIERWVG
jgi:hypothetical protein